MDFRVGSTIKDLLVAHKDKETITKRSGVTYRYKYNRMECNEETLKSPQEHLGEVQEHLKTSLSIYDHYNNTGHTTTVTNFIIVGRDDKNLIRAIKEAIYIRVNNPLLNKSIGKYHLLHIWNEVLFNISELKKIIHPKWPFHLPHWQ